MLSKTVGIMCVDDLPRMACRLAPRTAGNTRSRSGLFAVGEYLSLELSKSQTILTGAEGCGLHRGIPLWSAQEESVPVQRAKVVWMGGLTDGRPIGPV